MRHLFFAVLLATNAFAQTSEHPDLTSQPTLYVVGYAHLDTQWRWEYPKTIGEYLPKTMHDNFVLFEKYPHYVFNFSGANRYRMMKEYYPADYQKVQEYVRSGRWFVAGSAMEEGDVNSPSAESIIRQILYGTEYFRDDFGHTSAEYMLPDCFGFPASLPSLLAHMGIKGFSTQKLTWGSAAAVGGEDSPEKTPKGIPFNVGFWEGPDGRGVIAAFNPGSYGGDVSYDLTRSDPPTPAVRNYIDWPLRVQRNGKVSGLFTDYHYYGTGDTGGSAREPSVKLMETIVSETDAPLHVVSATAEQMFLDIQPSRIAGLPRYKGDLELTNHSAGSLTSQAYQKRWNRKNELLADAAEKASVAATWLGGRRYPQQRLNNAWTLVMGGQFHDIAAGTATPKSYEYSWNDDVIAMNQFAGVLTSATEAIASALDTQTKGTPVVVYNPLGIPREDIVEATMPFAAVRVIGPNGKPVPAQVSGDKVVFLASVPSVGFAVYDIQPSSGGQPPSAVLTANESSLENARYQIRLDQNGDISSIFDKKAGKELLAAPMRLALQTEKPHDWPAWNMDWADQQKPPRAYVQGPATVRIVENGPARVALQVSRDAEGSHFVQTIRLAAGEAGNRVEIDNDIDWKTAESALKATFPLTASHALATYNWEVGTVERGNNDEKKFEVPSHQWFDLTDKSGSYGVTVLSDCKYGSDKPDDNTLRLTLIYTPGLGEGNGRSYSDQTSQDWGHHQFVFGLAGHGGDWRNEQTDWQALRLNQPLLAFQSPKHAGRLGKKFSLLHLNNNRVRLLALKKAEKSDEVIVRIVEIDGEPIENLRIGFAAPVTAAREVNGQEMPIGKATVKGGALSTDLTPYQLRTFAVKLGSPASKSRLPHSRPLALHVDQSTFDVAGRTLALEMLPPTVDYGGIQFKLSGAGAVIPRGQTIPLPSNTRRVYVLAAADGDQKAIFHIGDQPAEVTVQDWTGFIGQWDNRTLVRKQEPLPPPPDLPPGAPPRMRSIMEFAGLTPGFIKRAPLAWFASHRHAADGINEPYAYSYLFAYSFEAPSMAKTMTLPDNDKIRILAISSSNERAPTRPAQPLYDTLER